MIEMPEKPAEDSSPANAPRRARRLFAVVALVAASGVFILAAQGGSPVSALSAKLEAGIENSGEDLIAIQGATGDYSKFPHTNQAHSRLPCLLCHRRENNSPAPKRSGHTPCAGCHTQQFAASSGPMCAICHTSAEQPTGAVTPFPPLKSFNMSFDHAPHKNAGGATCHKPARRGVALSIPAGLNAHATCYECHAPRAKSNGRD